MALSFQTLRRIVTVHPTLGKMLLGCGVVSSVVYVASDVIAALRYPGYHYIDQVVSELMAAGAPTRPLLVGLFTSYNVLVTAFGLGVWASMNHYRAGRATGATLITYGIFGQVALLLSPMSMRGDEGTFLNSMHVPATAVISLLTVAAMGFGAQLLGKRFRYYTYGTIVILFAFGIAAGLQGSKLAANQPTPWMGFEERADIYVSMLWLAVLAVGLLRTQGVITLRRPAKPILTRQRVK